MPELPEVENIKIGLSAELPKDAKLINIIFKRNDLRFIIPKRALKTLIGTKLDSISRNAKYLLFAFSNGTMISHLGMTGNWRIIKNANKKISEGKKHDHVYLCFNNNLQLIYNDPRRFGYLDFAKNSVELNKHPYFAKLGPDPFAVEFTAEYLKQKVKNSGRTIKAFLMDQSVVVGIGNIYASEILFKAKIKPLRKLEKIKTSEWQDLVKACQSLLQIAIDLGGSTIRDYRKSDGSSGSFQDHHSVYGKKDQACTKCGSKIQSASIGGRSTYWCPKCQV